MSREYMRNSAASRLNGAPPGYVTTKEGEGIDQRRFITNLTQCFSLTRGREKRGPPQTCFVISCRFWTMVSWQIARAQVDFSSHYHHDVKQARALLFVLTERESALGPGHSFDQKNMEKRIFERSWKKLSTEVYPTILMKKVVFHSLDNDHMQEVSRCMVKPVIASLVERVST